MNKLRRYLRLPSWQQRQIFSAWWLLLGFWVALRALPFKKVRRLAEVPTATPTEPTDMEALAWCVRAAGGSHWVSIRCLERSLTLQRLLRQRGFPAELRIGVEKAETTVSAHAWLEVEGEPIGEPEGIDQRFASLLQP